MELQALKIIATLQEHGYSAYLVGGYVRDRLLKRPIRDIDIATSARPEQVMNVFSRTVPTGLAHGTVTVLSGGYSFEVTTFRTETEYEAYRRPKQVHFIGDLTGDLRRRDFTMNAMAMDAEGTIIDPFGGQEDLSEQRLRCVGDPMDRFQEDGLRMLRCIRFAAEYRLQIERLTWQALLQLKPLLRHIAMERVHAELDKIVCGSCPQEGLDLLASSGVLHCFKADLALTPHQVKALQTSPALLNMDKLMAEPHLRWGLVLTEMGISSDQGRELLNKLLFSNISKKKILALLDINEAASQLTTSKDWKLLALSQGKEAMNDWLVMTSHRIAAYDQEAVHVDFIPPFCRELLRHGNGWLNEMTVWHLRQLACSGLDLKHLGAKGPKIGAILGQLLEDVALGLVPNEKDELLSRAQRYIRKLNANDT